VRRAVYGVTAVTLLSYAGEYMAFTSILAWLDVLLLNNGYSTLQAFGFGYLASSAYLVFSGVLAVPLGSLADLFGRRATAAVGCVLAGLAIFAVSLTGSISGATTIIISMSLLLLLIGVGHATYTTSALAYAGDVSSEQDVGEAYGLVETAEYTMFMFGTPLGFALAQAFGNQSTFYITGAILLAGALAAMVGMPERRTTVPSSATFDASHQTSNPSRWALLYRAVSDREVQVSLLAIFFVSVGFTMFRVYLTQYGNNASPSLVVGPYVVSIMALASVLAAVPIGRLVDVTKKRGVIMAAGFLVEGAALALIFFQPSALSLIVWSVIFGVAIMLVRVPQAVVVAERTVHENRATAMGTNHGIEHVGYGVGAFLGGALLLFLGFTTLETFWFVAGLSLAFGIALFPIIRELKMA
jgi:MFS family permease